MLMNKLYVPKVLLKLTDSGITGIGLLGKYRDLKRSYF